MRRLYLFRKGNESSGYYTKPYDSEATAFEYVKYPSIAIIPRSILTHISGNYIGSYA